MPEAQHVIMFHAITSGECWAELLDGSVPPFQLAAGDIVVVAMGDPHVFCSTPGLRAEINLNMYFRPTDRQLPFQISPPGGDGEQTRFACGYLGCDARPFNPVLQALPRILHVRGADGTLRMAQLIRMAVDESATRRSGGETVLSKLAELIFVEVVRRYTQGLPKDAGGWLSGLRDAHIGAALGLLHGRPAEAWTVERLAREVGVSRSALADRFAYFVHDTPMQYLTRWRMQLATHLLERPGVGLARVAAEVGYESEAAFNRAFRKCVGMPPGAWRRGRQASGRVAEPPVG
jgi:AraC-like DNA-binding protein